MFSPLIWKQKLYFNIFTRKHPDNCGIKIPGFTKGEKDPRHCLDTRSHLMHILFFFHMIFPKRFSLSNPASVNILRRDCRDSPPFFQASWICSGTVSNLRWQGAKHGFSKCFFPETKRIFYHYRRLKQWNFELLPTKKTALIRGSLESFFCMLSPNVS